MDPYQAGHPYKGPFWKRSLSVRKTSEEKELADLPVEEPQPEQHQAGLA